MTEEEQQKRPDDFVTADGQRMTEGERQRQLNEFVAADIGPDGIGGPGVVVWIFFTLGCFGFVLIALILGLIFYWR